MRIAGRFNATSRFWWTRVCFCGAAAPIRWNIFQFQGSCRLTPNLRHNSRQTCDPTGLHYRILYIQDRVREGFMNQQDDALNHHQNKIRQSSGLYVDVENLHSDGQAMIKSLVEDWPTIAPAPSQLALYVRADQVELWRLWAAARFKDLKVSIKGTQHFSLSSSKNSADIAIATNAIADLILKRVTHVAIFSDDSDFISLYVAIRDEPDVLMDDGEVPFLWVVIDRQGSLSTTIRQFFPLDQLHVVATRTNSARRVAGSKSSLPSGSENSPTLAETIWTEMADQIVKDIPIGAFKSTDCQVVIKKHWPQHPMAKAGGASFGSEFKNNIWPVLQMRGVKISDPGKAPIRYEMTADAKGSLP